MTINQFMLAVILLMCEILFEAYISRKSDDYSVKTHIKSHILMLIISICSMMIYFLSGDFYVIIIMFVVYIWHLNKEARTMCKKPCELAYYGR